MATVMMRKSTMEELACYSAACRPPTSGGTGGSGGGGKSGGGGGATLINAAKAVANRSGGPATGARPSGGGGGGGGGAATVVGGKAVLDGKPLTTKMTKDNQGWVGKLTAANGGGVVYGKTRLEVAQKAQEKATVQKADKAKKDADYKAIVDDHNKRVSETKWDAPEGGNANVGRWGKNHAPSHGTGKGSTIRMKDGNGVVEVIKQKNGIRIRSKVGGYENNDGFVQGTGPSSVRAAFGRAKLMQAENASKRTSTERKENERTYGVRDASAAKNPAALKYQGKVQRTSDVKTTRDGNLVITPQGYKPQAIGTIAKTDKGYTATVEGVTVTHKTRAGAVTAMVRKIRA